MIGKFPNYLTRIEVTSCYELYVYDVTESEKIYSVYSKGRKQFSGTEAECRALINAKI